MNCKDCKYWEYINEDELVEKPNTVKGCGCCHRYPPIQVVNYEKSTNLFDEDSHPIVFGDKWCGEFEAVS